MTALDVGAELLERANELALVESLVEQASHGTGCVLVIAGEPGIGKTTLLRAARERGATGGMRVVAGRGAELEREFSFGVVRQLLEPLLARASEDELERLLAGPAAAAGRLVAESPSGDDQLPSEALFAAIHALYWVVARGAAEQTLMVVVDDAHWADRESLRFLNYLAGRLEALPVAVVIASRVAEPGAEQALLDALAGEQAAHRLSLSGLSVDAVGRLLERHVGRAPDREFAVACHGATGGNPFLVTELMAGLSADAVAPVADNAGMVERLGPASVASAVLTRLGRLDPRCASLARAVAVLGPQTEIAVAAQLAGLNERDAAGAADELARAQVLAAARPLDFVHPILRTAIHEDIAPAERAAAHAAAAQILHASDASSERIAAHLVATDPGQGKWAVDVLIDAARRSMERGAPASAAPLLRRALAENPGPTLRADLLELLGLSTTTAGDPAGSHHLYQAVELFTDRRRKLKALTTLGSIHWSRGELEPAGAAYDHARDLADDVFPRTAWMLEIPAVALRLYDLSARRHTLRTLADLLQRPDLETTPVGRLLLMAEGFERCYAGDREGALAQVDRVLAHQRTANLSDTHAFCNAGLILGLCDEVDRALAVFTDTLEASTQLGHVVEAAHVHMSRAIVGLRSGDIDTAHDDAVRAVEGVAYGWGNMTPSCHANLADTLMEKGDLAGAAVALEIPGGDDPWRGRLSFPFLLEARGHHRLLRGDLAGARELFRQAGDLLADGLIPYDSAFAVTPWRVGAALATAGLGDQDEARTLIAEELDQARKFGVPRSIGMALRVSGLVEGGDQGIDLLREAITVLDPDGARLEHARALVDLGAALRRRGDRRDAREPLNDGLALARRCGATALAQRAHDELAATGVRPRKILRAGVDALTASEHRVARMAAQGMSNKEIAGQLFLTVNTVQTHLHRAYRKLDITSRDQLSAALGTE